MPAVKLPPCVYHERHSAWTAALPTMAHGLAAVCVLGKGMGQAALCRPASMSHRDGG